MDDEFTHLTKKERRQLHKQQKEEERKREHFWQNIKRIVIWTVIFIGIGSIIFAVLKTSSSNPSISSTVSLNLTDADWSKSDKNAKAVLVEYSDFQCPACAFYYSMVNSLEREIGKKMLFVYRHYPLPQHKNARLAAQAAEAAGLQGKFWEMHALLFENQKIWLDTDDARKIFTDYAKSLNLDLVQFEKDLDSQKVKDKVENDLRSGQALGVDATPTFYLNGKKLNNLESYDQFKKIIEQEIAK